VRRLAVALGLLISVPVAAATFTVLNTNDSGAGSLRQANEAPGCTPVLDRNPSSAFIRIRGVLRHRDRPIKGSRPLLVDHRLLDEFEARELDGGDDPTEDGTSGVGKALCRRDRTLP